MSVGRSVTLSLREQFMHYRPCPTTCDWSCRVYGTPLCPCPPPYRSCPPGPPKGGSPLLPNWTRAVFALLPLPNKLEQMLSCIQHPHSCPLPRSCPSFTAPAQPHATYAGSCIWPCFKHQPNRLWPGYLNFQSKPWGPSSRLRIKKMKEGNTFLFIQKSEIDCK